MESADPQNKPGDKPGKKRCGAQLRNKPGRRCKSDKLMPNGRCRLHGGKTPEGPASPNWKHGQRSKHRWMASLPGGLGTRFDAALADPTLTSLRHAIALNDAMITSYTAGLKDTGRPLTHAQQKRVHELLNVQRQLAGDEARRLRDLATMVTQAQFTMVVNGVVTLINEFLDLKQRQDFHRRLQAILLTSGRRPETADTVIDSE